MARPAEVERYVVSAAGWYTLPDRRLNFPFGIGPTEDLPGFEPDPRAFLAVPGCVFVGAHDTRRGRTLNQMERLDAEQGPTRLDRGRRWAAVMNRTAVTLHLPPPIKFGVLPDAGHLFSSMTRRGGLAVAAFEFLFGASGGVDETGRAGAAP